MKQRRLKLMADYHCAPLWEYSEPPDDLYANWDPAELPLRIPRGVSRGVGSVQPSWSATMGGASPRARVWLGGAPGHERRERIDDEQIEFTGIV